jgi:hypothetical protein
MFFKFYTCSPISIPSSYFSFSFAFIPQFVTFLFFHLMVIGSENSFSVPNVVNACSNPLLSRPMLLTVTGCLPKPNSAAATRDLTI